MARLAIRMPKMSMTMTEGEVATWLVSVGDEIAEGDVVAEVMTDKVDMEVESTVSGTLVEIVVDSGTVPVGEPIGWVEGDDDGGGFGDLLAQPEPDTAQEPGAAQEQAAPSGPEGSPEPPPAAHAAEATAPLAGGGPVPAVPRARGLAREHGIDLASLPGSGPGGLVTVADVEARLGQAATAAVGSAGATVGTEPTAPPPSTPAPTPTATSPSTPAATPAVTPGAPPAARTAADERSAKVRAAVARAMEASAAVPQFTVWREIRLDEADTHRNGVSWTTVLIRAYAAALREVPELLCRWPDGRAVPSGPPSVTLAVATDRGLLAPVFAEPDAAEPAALDAEIRDVVRTARTGRLGPAYLGLANATLSNLGGQGVDRFQALLTPPQASVLALGSIRQRPVAVPGGVGLALTVHAGVTVDHRVADGAHAADLLARLAAHLGDGQERRGS